MHSGIDRSEEESSLDVIKDRDVVDSDCIYQVKGVSALDFERLLTALEAGMYVTPFCLHCSCN